MRFSVFFLFILCVHFSYSQCNLYSINVIWTPNERNLAEINPTTAKIDILTNDFLFEWYITNGGASVDPVNNIYYIKGTEYDIGGESSEEADNVLFRLYGIDINTGKIVSKPEIEHNNAVHQLLFNCIDSSLYGIEVLDDTRYLVKVNPITGIQTRISPSSIFEEYNLSSLTAIDPFKNIYYAVSTTFDYQDYYLTATDINTGLVVSNNKLDNVVQQMAFNCSDGLMYGIEQDINTGGHYLVTINTDNGTITRLSGSSLFSTYYYSSGSVIDPQTNSYFIIGEDTQMRARFYEIDLTTGKIKNSTIVSSSDEYHMMRSNCNCIPEADFEIRVACVGEEVQFTPTLQAGNVSWEFGDPASGSNNTSNEIFATHKYTNPGSYQVTLLAKGCASSKTITKTIQIGQSVEIDLGNDTTICKGKSLIVDAGSGNTTYLWNTGETSQSIKIITGGAYSVTVSNRACQSADTIAVSVEDISFDFGNDISTCNNSYMLSTNITGVDYQWQDGSVQPTYNVVEAGLYTVTVCSDFCCFTDSINISFQETSKIFTTQDTTLCNGSDLVLDAGSGNNYLWQDGSGSSTYHIKHSGEYWVMKELNNCKISDTIQVAIEPNITLDLGNDITTCIGDTVQLYAATNADYIQWNTGSANKKLEVHNSGTYIAQAYINSCSNSDTIQVRFTRLKNTLPPDTSMCANDILFIEYTDYENTIQWQDSSAEYYTVIDTPGVYNYTISNTDCVLSDSILVSIKNCDCFIYVPNALSLSHHSSQVNSFVPKGQNLKSYELYIYDKWGNLVWYTNTLNNNGSPSEYWNGKFSGSSVQIGSYFWVLKAECESDEYNLIEKMGSINVVE